MSVKTGLLLGATAAVAASLLGCGGPLTPGGGTSEGNNCPSMGSVSGGSGGGPSTNPPEHETDVAACAGGASQADIDANLQVSTAMESTMTELTGCGQISHGLSALVSEFFAKIGCGVPISLGGLTYAGSGLYLAGNVMQVQAKLAKDTSFGKAGDDVPFDLLDQGSYWEGVTIKATLSLDATWDSTGQFGSHLKGTYEITMQKPKPQGLELWGIPATENQPVEKKQEELAKAIAESVVFVVDIKPEPTNGIKLWLTSPPLGAGDLYNGNPLPFQVTSVGTTDALAAYSITSKSWDISFLPAYEGVMTGSATLQVQGGKFPYYTHLTYPKRATPDVSVTCNPPSP